MRLIDWLLVIIPIAFVLGVAVYTRRFVKSVADFLAAGRCAGRYLLANARGESDSGLANTMSKFEMILVSGFVLNFWEKVSIPALLLVGITGFVVYRFRETRALTLAQFFEMRYSRRFRLFMGALAFVSGILNYGIFPAVSARFFIYFLGLPLHVQVFGLTMPTFALIMAAYLACTVFMITIGGQVTLMVTDCIEGLLSHAIYIAIVIAVFFVVSWSQIVDVMGNMPAGYSHIDPFDAGEVEDFNIWYVAMALIITIYTTMALQNKQGFNSAARTPHESRMGNVLGYWRTYARLLMILVLGICAVTYLQHPDFAQPAKQINAEIGQIHDHYLQRQMTVPIALSHLLPVGIKGLFCAMMIMGLLAGDSGHMHSWGSILIQDVIAPLRKKPMTQAQHMWALRLAVLGVAVFAFVFSMLFQQTQYIALWWAVTAGVFTGGAGAAIIGGLYWRKGTTGAAWAATITGSTLSLVGILLTNGTVWRWVSDHVAFGVAPPARFWLNGQQVAMLAACSAVAVYVIVSLLTRRAHFDLDRLLHRNEHARADEHADHAVAVRAPTTLRDRFRLKNILGFDENFTFTDKLVSGGIFWWSMLLLAVNLIVTALNLFVHDWPVAWWAHYWMIAGIAVPLIIAVATLVWFGIGGTKDMLDFFHALRTMKRDVHDDGRVHAPAGAPTMTTAAAPQPIVPAVQPTPEGDAALKTGAAVGAPPVG
jgi:SSS family solute:Na+ symporter